MLSVGRNRKRQRNLIFPHFHTHSTSGSAPQNNNAQFESVMKSEAVTSQSAEQLSNFSQSLTLSERSGISGNQQFSSTHNNEGEEHEEEKRHEPHETPSAFSLPSLSSTNPTTTPSTSTACSSSSTSTSCFFKVTKIQPLHLFLPKLSYSTLHSLTHPSLSHSSKSHQKASVVKNVTFSTETKTWDGPRESLVCFDELLFCFLVKGKAIGDGDVLKWTKRSVTKITSLTFLLLDLLHRINTLDNSNNSNNNNNEENKDVCVLERTESEESGQNSQDNEESVPCLPHGGGHALRVEKSYKPYLVTLLSVLITALKHALKVTKKQTSLKEKEKEKETENKENMNKLEILNANELGLEEAEVCEYSEQVKLCLEDISKINNLTFFDKIHKNIVNEIVEKDSRIEVEQN